MPETYRLDPVAFTGWATSAFPGHPLGLLDCLGFGSVAEVCERLDRSRDLGVGIALVAATTSDPGAERTLRAIAA